MGESFFESSVSNGGKSGVAARTQSSSGSDTCGSIGIGSLPDSDRYSSPVVQIGEGGRWLSCWEMALNAGPMT